MDYHTSIANIRSLASGIGTELTRPQAAAKLRGGALKSMAARNPLSSEVIQLREVGPYIVEASLADFTGMRGVNKYMVGVTVWKGSESCFDLSECIDIEALPDKLRALREGNLS